MHVNVHAANKSNNIAALREEWLSLSKCNLIHSPPLVFVISGLYLIKWRKCMDRIATSCFKIKL